ncbi:MAG: phage minor capsid protein [Oscillospiraceae bacterium]|nr:phage minor capsid protein [Oscillospiraceae bacterium]
MPKTQLDFLTEIYREAQLQLIKIISGNYGVGTKTYYNSILKQLESLMKQLQNETGRYIEMSVPKAYKKALNETYKYFQKNHLRMKQPDMFTRIHSDAVYQLSREMQYHINQGISQAGRRVIRYLDTSRDNILRQEGLFSSAVKIASGQTVRDMQKDLLERLAKDGFLTVQYGSGKRAYQVGLDTYTAMVARSTTREAGNLARKNQLIENDYDLMIMSEHYPTCNYCAIFQGRVYSISGKDKRFPPLSTVFSDGYMNTHPNCSHVVVPYIEELKSPEELEKALERSNEPFKDNRSDKEKSLYTEQQTKNRRMRSDRSQYERYKAKLKDDAPKTFSAFRRIKNSGGQSWKNLKKQYRNSEKR